MTRAAIWDMDGTLVDTAELHFEAWRRTCAGLGRDFSRDDFAATFGRRNPEIMHILFGDRFSPSEIDAIGEHKEELYRAEARKGVELLPGVAELMEGLHRAGFRQAIGSSAPHANLDLILGLTGVAKYLGAVVGAEDTTRGKPDPQVFLVGAERLGVEPARCVVFEDAPAGVQAAKAGGMKAVGVGFVGHHDAASLKEAGADVVVHSLRELDAEAVARLVGE
jgi:beta-phosphoglucomutase